MSRRLACFLFALIAVAACGDDDGSANVDSGLVDSRLMDAPASDCDYTEQSDLSNDTSSTGGVTETTGLTFSSRTVVCGTVDHTHFDGDITIDGDSYTLTVAAETDVIIRMVAPGAASLELVGVDINGSGGSLAGTLTYYGNHGVVSARLPAGTFELLMLSLGGESITSSVPYRIEVVADMPDTRCPEVTVGGFMEANDSGNNTGNDVYAYPSGNPVAFTGSTTDAPEPTNIVLAPGVDIRFYGTAADIMDADKFEDTDTYEIATGAGTNELGLRLTWPTAGANLDWFLYEQNTTSPIAGGTSTATTGVDMRLTAVKPNTTYWLAVSAVTGTAVPATYNATLCGAQYTP